MARGWQREQEAEKNFEGSLNMYSRGEFKIQEFSLGSTLLLRTDLYVPRAKDRERESKSKDWREEKNASILKMTAESFQ